VSDVALTAQHTSAQPSPCICKQRCYQTLHLVKD